jgi:integrase/recombinase XerD
MTTKNRKIPIVLSLDEIDKLKKAPNPRYPSSIRDKVIIYLTLNTGLRVDEIINLKLNNIDLKNKTINLEHAKKNSFGSVVFNSSETILLIKKWLKVRPAKSYWLFCTITKEKKVANRGGITSPGNKLSRQYLTEMVKKYADRSGIDKNISFHTLRHTYATWLYIKTHDIEVVRQQLRHKSINTTTIYTQTAWQFEGHKALNGFEL